MFTESGATARQLSKYHPTAPIFALSPVEITVNRLNLLWGTTPIRCPKVNSTEALVECAENLLEQNEYVRTREVIAIVAGTRTKSGSTNFMRLHVMGEQKLEGVRFHITRDQEAALQEQTEGKRVPAKKAPRTFKRLSIAKPAEDFESVRKAAELAELEDTVILSEAKDLRVLFGLLP